MFFFNMKKTDEMKTFRKIIYQIGKIICRVLPLLVLIFLGLSLNLAAEKASIKFDHIGIEHGLSQSSIFSILQDSKGFMWIGTESGVNRYDGYNFIVYTPDISNPKSLSNNWVYSVYEDHLGNLWIGTDDGLNRFNREKETFKRYFHDPEKPNSLSNNKVFTIFEDRSGSLWIGTDNGLNKFDRKDESFKRYQFDPENPQSLSDNHIRCILEDASGMLWVGTDNGLNRFNRKEETWIRFQSDPKDPNSLSHNSINSICEDSLGMLWVGTDRGLNHFDPRTGKFMQYKHIANDSKSLSDDWIHVVYQDRLGILWIGTNEGGLNRFEREKGEFICYKTDPNNPYSLSSNRIYSICEDQSGVIWVGTYGGAICKFNREPKRFRRFTHDPKNPNSLSHMFVRSFYEDQSGTLWVGTDGGGLNKYDREKDQFIHYRYNPRDPASLSNDRVFSIVEDSSGVFWIGTYGGGLNRFDPKSGKFARYRHSPTDPNTLSDDRIRVIYEGQPGVLWIGTDGGGINKFETVKGIFTRYRYDPNDPNSLSNDRTWSILKSDSGSMWIATFGGGLNKFDPEKGQFFHYRFDPDDPNSLSNDYITTLYKDQSGILWIGSNGEGLIRFYPQKETFSNFSESEGLAGSAIYGILEDDEGNLWISTNNGLSKFNPQKETFRNYDANDGLQSNEFNGGARYKNPKGEMFFGGINGFNSFYPETIKDNPYIPYVVITNFRIFNKVVPIQEEKDGKSPLTKSITETDKIELSYRDNMLSFEFAALHYVFPNKNEYAYMMEGLDKDWIYTSSAQRFATYTNLNPGKYTFRVKGSNNDGLWNEEGVSLKIKIVPPFWQTWWFRSLVIVTLLLLLIGVFQIRTSSIRKRALQLEEIVEGRTSELTKEIALRKRTEENLQTEKAYLDQLFESAQEAIVMTEDNGRVIRVNSEFTSLFGYTHDEAVGKFIDDLVARDNLRDEAAAYTKKLKEGKLFDFESVRQHKDGRFINVSVIGAPIIVGNKQVATYAIYRDITKRKQAEEKLRKMTEELERSNKELEQFAYIASHDLQEPLRMVASYAQLLAKRYKGKLDSDADEFIDYAVDGANRMQRMINDLLTYSRVGTRDKPFVPTDCELVLNYVMTNLQVLIKERSAKVTHDTLPTIMADEFQLIQLLQNLISNAIKFCDKESPRIHISAEKKTEEWLFSVRDNGIGIDSQHVERIFQIFQRLHGRDEYPGTGIGLAVCKRIVERHGGRIWVDSEQSKGSKFYFTIPVRRKEK